MRYYELVEYKQDITLQKFRSQFLWSFMSNPGLYDFDPFNSLSLITNFFQMNKDEETRAFYLKLLNVYAYGSDQEYENFKPVLDKFVNSSKHSNYARHVKLQDAYNDRQDADRIRRSVTACIVDLENIDPSNNKQYVLWLLKLWFNPNQGRQTYRWEDIMTEVAQFLEQFHTLKIKRRLPYEWEHPARDITVTIPADINQVKAENIRDLIVPVSTTYRQVMGQEAEKKLPRGDAETVYEDDEVRVVIPKDKEAACYYGQGTQWCTAATGSYNYFDNYNERGPLYIILPKKPEYDGEKYQLHIYDKMYMNEQDRRVLLSDLFKTRFPNEKLKNFFQDAGIEFDEMLMFNLDKLEWVNDVIKEIFSWALVRFENEVFDLESEYYHDYMDSLERDGYLDDEGEIKDDADPYSFIEWASDTYDGRYTLSAQQSDLQEFAENTEIKDLDNKQTDFGLAYEIYLEEMDEYEDSTVGNIPKIIASMLIGHNESKMNSIQKETKFGDIAEDINRMGLYVGRQEGVLKWKLTPSWNPTLTPIATGEIPE